MRYKELLEMYREGKLEESEKNSIEVDIEKQEAISEYLFEINEDNLFDKETSFENAYFYPAVNTHYLSKDRVFELHKSAIKRFYLRPMYILKMLTRIRSFAEVKNYFIAGMNVLLRR